jgi:hypothetical protein
MVILTKDEKELFDKYFLGWSDSLKLSHDMRAVLIDAILSYEFPVKLMKVFFDKRTSLKQVIDTLIELKIPMELIAKIDVVTVREFEADKAKANNENQVEVAGAKDSATDLALVPASASPIKSVLGLLPRKKPAEPLVLEPQDGANVKAGQTITQSGTDQPEGTLPIPEFGPMRPPTLRKSGTPLVLADEGLGTAGNTGESGDSEEDSNQKAQTQSGKPGLHRTSRPPVLETYSALDWFKSPRATFEKWNKNREINAASKTGKSSSSSRKGVEFSGAKITLYVILLAIVVGIVWVVANANPQGISSGGADSQQIIQEAPPVDPNNIPLDVEGSVNQRGFVGELQKFIYALSILTFLAVLGDRLYGRQFTDIIVYLIVTYSSIFLVLPSEVGVVTSVIVLLLLVGWITTASVQGEGKDFTIMVGWLLSTATIGGLVLTKIAVISNIFHKMTVGRVMAVVDLGYYFDTASLGLIAFSFVVYAFAFLALIVAIYEAVRRSEEGTMPLAPLICGLFGILSYFASLHLLNLVPWLSSSIGMLVSVAIAGMAISPTGRQFVPREWANKSAYDGAVLYLAVMTVLVIIFGNAGWLIGY